MKTSLDNYQNAQQKYFNIFVLARRMSITAKASILHRITAILILLFMPYLVWILMFKNHLCEVNSINNFLLGFYNIYIFRFIFIAIFIYHAFAQIRFFLLDLKILIEPKQAVMTAYIVIVSSVAFSAFLSLA